jgi:hypothetical protein
VRLESFTIKRVLAFGDEHTLSFRDLGPGLIALTGRIGRGKTTLLEGPVATLYRQFPSRERKEPFDYATATDAFLETVFELEGRGLYRARLNLDGPHRRQEAVLLRRDADGRELFVADKQSLASYDAAIRELLPSLDQLLASVLAVQTRRGSFSERDRKSRREVLQSFLGLDGMETKAERARQAIARVTQQIEAVTLTRDAIAREAGDVTEDTIEQRAQDLQVRAGQAEIRREEVRRYLAAAEEALQAFAAEAHTYAAAAAATARYERDVADRTRDRDHVQTALDRHRREGQAERQRLIERHTAWLARNDADQRDTTAYEADVADATRRRDATIRDLEQRIASNKDLMARAAAIRAAAARYTEIGTQIAQEAEAAKSATQQAEASQTADTLARASLADLDAKATALRRAEADAALLTAVPCHGDADYASCQFLTNAQRAKGQIAGLREIVAARPVLEQELQAIGDRLRDARARAAAATTAIDALTKARTTLAKDAAELTNLELAEDRISTRTQQIAEAHALHARELQAAVLRSAAVVERLRDRTRSAGRGTRRRAGGLRRARREARGRVGVPDRGAHDGDRRGAGRARARGRGDGADGRRRRARGRAAGGADGLPAGVGHGRHADRHDRGGRGRSRRAARAARAPADAAGRAGLARGGVPRRPGRVAGAGEGLRARRPADARNRRDGAPRDAAGE